MGASSGSATDPQYGGRIVNKSIVDNKLDARCPFVPGIKSCSITKYIKVCIKCASCKIS